MKASDLALLDTNVIVYAVDSSSPYQSHLPSGSHGGS